MCANPGEVDTGRGSLGSENSPLACSKETSPPDLVSTRCQGLCLLPLSLQQKEGITPCPGRGTRAEVSSGSSQGSSLAELTAEQLLGNFGPDASSDTASLGRCYSSRGTVPL